MKRVLFIVGSSMIIAGLGLYLTGRLIFGAFSPPPSPPLPMPDQVQVDEFAQLTGMNSEIKTAITDLHQVMHKHLDNNNTPGPMGFREILNAASRLRNFASPYEPLNKDINRLLNQLDAARYDNRHTFKTAFRIVHDIDHFLLGTERGGDPHPVFWNESLAVREFREWGGREHLNSLKRKGLIR